MSNKILKNNNQDKKNNQIHMLITMMTIAMTCVFCAIMMIQNSGVQVMKDNRETIINDKSSWVKSYHDEESIQVAIEFDYIDTSENRYELLRESCNKYIEAEDTPNYDIIVDTAVSIKEDIHIDVNKSNIINHTTMSHIDDIIRDLGIEYNNIKESNIKNIINKADNNEYMHETGPIYFQDRLLLRYINSSGNMQVVLANLINEVIESTGDTQLMTDVVNEKIVTFGRNELQSGFDMETATQSTDTIKTVISNNIMTEEEYINDIAELFIYILKTDSNNLNQKFQKQALKYFTLDGYNNIIDSKNRILLDDNTQIEVTILEAGKSNTSLSTKDRIFMQLKSDKNGKETITNIIVKLNSNFKIFDIDIL